MEEVHITICTVYKQTETGQLGLVDGVFSIQLFLLLVH